MRSLLAALIAVAAVGALAACARGATGAPARCAPAAAQVKLADRRAQLYALSKTMYACDRRTHHTTKLGSTATCIATARVDGLALAGDVASYGLNRCGVDTGSTSVVVRRLSDGKRLHSFAAITGPGLPESYQSINALIVTTKGAVAWIATDHSIVGHRTRAEVHANGKLLDSGAGIVGSSLRLHGSTLTWRDGSTTRTSAL